MNLDLLRYAELNGHSVVLYGAGKYGRIALANIKRKYPQVSVKYFIDDNLIRNNGDVEGIHVVSLNTVIDELDIEDIVVVISNYYVVETIKKIEKAGIDLSKVFFTNNLLIAPIEKAYIQEKRNQLTKVYDFLQDYESKLIYKTMIESRITDNIDALSRTCRSNQYFPTDIFQITQEEVFVDGGAFDGDTIDSFLQMTQGEFKYIYAFEPDIQNYSKLACNHQNNNIKLFNMGLFNEEKIISFSSCRGGSSGIDSEGKDAIKVCCFDKLDVPDRNISFVKMDIEGSELNALEGMKNTICKCKPKLAICIYHKFEDLWEIPLFIKKLVPEYKIYIRNHTTYLDEIVLYATV